MIEDDYEPVLGPPKKAEAPPKRTAKRHIKRGQALRRLCNEVLKAIIWIEEKHTIFVRSFRILIDPNTVLCKVRIFKNVEGNPKAEQEVAKRHLLGIVGNHWVRMRFDRIYIECNLENGVVSLRYQDWGIPKAPADEYGIFDEIRIDYSMGCDVAVDGYLYDDPKSWVDQVVSPKSYDKSAKDIIESYLKDLEEQRGIQGS